MDMRGDDMVGGGDLNPYIALADVMINLVLILAFFVAAVNALGRAGWEQVRYRDRQEEFRTAIVATMTEDRRPSEHVGRHDPPGVQRWVFTGHDVFEPGTTQLTDNGRSALIAFARVLREHQSLWRRVRIEGHTIPPRPGTPDDWELSADRAAVVARIIHARGHIPSYYIAVAGRAGQNPVDKANPDNPANERVEILLEYARQEAGGE